MSEMGKMLRLFGKSLRCSFCGKSEHEVQKLVAGPRVFICDACVAICADVLENGPPLAKGGKTQGRLPGVGERLGDWFGRLRRATLHLVEVGR